MLVRDQPFVIYFAEASCCTHPYIRQLLVRPHPTDPVEAVAEGNVITCSDGQVTNLVAEGAFPRCKPLLPVSPICVRPPVEQRRREVEQQDIRRIVGHDPVDILGPDCLYPTGHQRPDQGFIACSAVPGGHAFRLCERPIPLWRSVCLHLDERRGGSGSARRSS